MTRGNVNDMHQRTRNESGFECGVLSQRVTGASIASRSVRSTGLGALLLLAALVTGAGCSGDSNTATGGGSAGSATSGGTGGTIGGGGGAGGGGNIDSSTACAVRTDVDLYSANMTKKGVNGLMSFLLIQSEPGPPINGDNSWKIKVTDASNSPITTDLVVEPFMPEHGHPSTKTPKVTYDATTGTFKVEPIYLSMSGKWRVRLKVTDPSDSTLDLDRADFFFCVD
jgi:YtkA-like